MLRFAEIHMIKPQDGRVRQERRGGGHVTDLGRGVRHGIGVFHRKATVRVAGSGLNAD